jgi:hypothetical protein
MGCDIHCHLEVKINNKWEHYSKPYIPRNYKLFGLMAGVRNKSMKPIVLPKGLPIDLSIITKIDWEIWETDAHDTSWFNVDEIKILEEYLEKDKDLWWKENYMYIWGYLFGNRFGDLFTYKNDYPKEIEDVRLIFWFDN